MGDLSHALILEKFKEFDTDGNGTIDGSELAATLLELDPDLWTESKVEQLMDSVDKSGDDKIQIEEFIAWLWGSRRDAGGEGSLTLFLCSPFLITSSQDCTAKIWSIETGECWQTLPAAGPNVDGHGGPVLQAQFSPDGHMVITACEDGRARIWNLADGKITHCFVPSGDVDHPIPVLTARFSHTGETVLTASGDVCLWSVTKKTWKCLLRIESARAGKVCSAVFCPHEHIALTAQLDGSAATWNLHTGERIQIYEGEHFGRLYSAVFTREGTMIATASGDGTIIVWDRESAEVIRIYEVGSSAALLSEFSIDGQFLLAANKNGASLWSVETEKECVKEYPSWSGYATCARFCPANLGLAMCNSDGSAHVYNAASGKRLRTLMGHDGAVNWVAWSPPESVLWDWAPETPGQSQLVRHLSKVLDDDDFSANPALSALLQTPKHDRFDLFS